MTPGAHRYAAAALLYLASFSMPAPAASAPGAVTCPLEALGTWRLATSAESEPRLLSFSADGWANVLGGPAGQPAAQFDILAQVRYELIPARNPQRIEFRTRRGNDLFAPGLSRWEISAYTDESFTARPVVPEQSEQALWVRVPTQRYFLTFAARDSGPGAERAALVLWTTQDGKKTQLEALGTATRAAAARFGRIPTQLASTFASHSKRESDVMMRIELSEAEYRRTHAVYEAWDAIVRHNMLAEDDPHGHAMQLLDATIQSVNRCRTRLRLADANLSVAAASGPQVRAELRPIEVIRTLRKLNDRHHVPDKVVSSPWQPPAVPAGAN